MQVNINRPIDQLAEALTKAEAKQEFLGKKIEEIEDNADDHERDLTASEKARVDKLTEQIEDLEAQIDAINNALDYLNEYYI